MIFHNPNLLLLVLLDVVGLLLLHGVARGRELVDLCALELPRGDAVLEQNVELAVRAVTRLREAEPAVERA